MRDVILVIDGRAEQTMNLRYLGWLVALIAIAEASSALATVFHVTYTGTVAAGSSDGLTLFGGGDLAGKSYKAKYTYNDAIGSIGSTTTSTNLSGGSNTSMVSPIPDPFGPAFLTINGITREFSSSFYSEEEQEVGIQILSDTMMAKGDQLTNEVRDSFSIPNSISTPFSTTGTGYGDLAISLDGGMTDVEYINLNSYVATVTLNSLPEPGTWETLLLGLAGVGACVRARPRKLRGN